MKKVLGLLGVAAACGVCCAFPVALPLLGGLAASGLGVTLGWEAAAVVAVVALGAVVIVRGHQARSPACKQGTEGAASCGCAPSGTACKGDAL